MFCGIAEFTCKSCGNKIGCPISKNKLDNLIFHPCDYCKETFLDYDESEQVWILSNVRKYWWEKKNDGKYYSSLDGSQYEGKIIDG